MSLFRGQTWTKYSVMEWELLRLLHRSHGEYLATLDQQHLMISPISHHLIRLGDYETEVDYYFKDPADVCVYIDGPHHQSRVHAKRDRQVSHDLRERGYFVLREPYEKDTMGTRREILQSIISVVNTRAKQHYDTTFQPRVTP